MKERLCFVHWCSLCSTIQYPLFALQAMRVRNADHPQLSHKEIEIMISQQNFLIILINITLILNKFHFHFTFIIFPAMTWVVIYQQKKTVYSLINTGIINTLTLYLWSEINIFFIFSCYRWDIIVNATEPAGNYWMYFRGLTDCSQRKTQTVAVLHYEGASDTTPTSVPNSYDERPDNFIVSIWNRP